MNRIFFYFVFFVTSFLNASSLEFEYEYNNPTLGPIYGYHNVEVKIINSKVVSIKDLQSGKKYKNYHKKFPEISTILKVLNRDSKGYIVRYNKDNLPIEIISKKIGYKIKINYNATNESLIEKYKDAVKKWQDKEPKKYKYVYQIRGDKRFKDGIEVTINRGKIVKAIDVFSRKRVDKKGILTLDKLFLYAKLAMKSKTIKRVYFDKKRGFVRFLEYRAKGNKVIKIAVFNFVELK